MKTTDYKGYEIETKKNNSLISKNGVLLGCTTSDINYDENNNPIYNSEDKAMKRIDEGKINMFKSLV